MLPAFNHITIIERARCASKGTLMFSILIALIMHMHLTLTKELMTKFSGASSYIGQAMQRFPILFKTWLPAKIGPWNWSRDNQTFYLCV